MRLVDGRYSREGSRGPGIKHAVNYVRSFALIELIVSTRWVFG